MTSGPGPPAPPSRLLSGDALLGIADTDKRETELEPVNGKKMIRSGDIEDCWNAKSLYPRSHGDCLPLRPAGDVISSTARARLRDSRIVSSSYSVIYTSASASAVNVLQ